MQPLRLKTREQKIIYKECSVLYGAITYTILKVDRRKTEVFTIWWWRRTLNIPQRDKIRNEDVYTSK